MSPHPGSAHRLGRPLRALVAVALAAGVLTACGGGGGDSGGSTSIAVSHGYTDAEATALKAQPSTVERRSTPTRRSSLQFNGGNDNALQKTVAGFTAGQLPRRLLPVRLVGRPARHASPSWSTSPTRSRRRP